MTLLQRFLSSILCCVIAVGYAPAWLHVSTCHDRHASEADSDKAGSACLPSCSHSHVNQSHASHDDGPTDTDGHQSPNKHDSDTCFVCQSLANATGVTLELGSSLEGTSVNQPAFLPDEPIFIGLFLSIAQARGPPASA